MQQPIQHQEAADELSLDALDEFGILPTPPQKKGGQEEHDKYINHSFLEEGADGSSPFQKGLDMSDGDEL